MTIRLLFANPGTPGADLGLPERGGGRHSNGSLKQGSGDASYQ